MAVERDELEKPWQPSSPEDSVSLKTRGEGAPKANAATVDGGPVEKKASVNNMSAIPNGGLVAWLQVLGSFTLFFNSWGVINTFGAFQTYYETGLLSSSSPSNISWIGSIQACMLLLVGAATGPVYDAGYFRPLIMTGSFLVIFGMMMTSICNNYWEVLLAQGFCMGIGAGCFFVPAVAIISTYFTTKLATAVGLAASGSSLGGIIYPIVFYRLQPTIGYGWAVRVIGFMMLGTLLIPIAVMKVRVLPAQRRKFLDLTAFKEPEYVLFVFGCFAGFMGLYAPFFYIQTYAITTGITGYNLGFYLLAILNAASVFGRIVPNYIADKAGPFNVIVPCASITGILCLCLLGIHNAAGIIVLTALFGFFSGTFVSLPPTCYVHLSPNRGLIGTRIGMGFACVSIGVLVGAPIAGAILDTTSSGFAGVWGYAGALVIGGAISMAGARVIKGGWNPWVKV